MNVSFSLCDDVDFNLGVLKLDGDWIGLFPWQERWKIGDSAGKRASVLTESDI